MAGFILLMR